MRKSALNGSSQDTLGHGAVYWPSQGDAVSAMLLVLSWRRAVAACSAVDGGKVAMLPC